MYLPRCVAAGLAAVVLTCLGVTTSQADVFRFRGTGTLGGSSPPFGTLGEDVSFVFDLNSELLTYDPAEAPAIRNFTLANPLTLSMTGATSGAFPDIDPVTHMRAVDGAPGSADDLLEIRSGTASAFDTLLRLRCPSGDCFGEATSPTTSADFVSTLGAALANPNQWMIESAQVASSVAQTTYTVEGMEWGFRSISHANDVVATFDVQYVPEESPSLTEGSTSLLVGGISGFFPPTSTAILEFDLGGIPAGAVVTSATLKLGILSQSGSPNVTLVTYPGDGIASEEDGEAEGLESTVGPLNIVTASSLDLDAGYIQSLVGTNSHVGVRLSSETDGKFLTFASLENPSANLPTLVFEYLYEAPIGDFNADGAVDAADYVLWRNTFGSTTDLAADANGNGEVGTEDYLVWKEAYGAAEGDALIGTTARVPEPGSILCALVAMAVVTGFRRLG